MTHLRRTTLCAFVVTAGLGLLGRVAIPPGFMPAPLAEGWPVTICPAASGALAAMTTSTTASHHGHHGTGEGDSRDGEEPTPHDQGSNCPLGLSLAAPSLLADCSLTHLTLEIGRIALPAITAAVQRTYGLVQSRAPPR
jgi:hypothetical protein